MATRQAGTTPVAAANRHRHTETSPVENTNLTRYLPLKSGSPLGREGGGNESAKIRLTKALIATITRKQGCMWFAPASSKGALPQIMCKLGATAGSISSRLTLSKLHRKNNHIASKNKQSKYGNLYFIEHSS